MYFLNWRYGSVVKNPLKPKAGDEGDEGSILGREDPVSMKWQLALIYWPAKFHRPRSLVVIIVHGVAESQKYTTELMSMHNFSQKLQSQDSYQLQES